MSNPKKKIKIISQTLFRFEGNNKAQDKQTTDPTTSTITTATVTGGMFNR